MPFVAARCPQCGGELQLDNQKETGFCMHCGSRIVVQEAIRTIRIDNTNKITTWIRMADSAAIAGNNREAYEYYTKVAENDPNNWKAVFLRGKAAGWQSSFSNQRINEYFQGVDDAYEILKKNNPSQKDIIEANKLFGETTFVLIDAFREIVNDILIEKFDRYTEDLDLIWDVKRTTINCVGYLQKALYFLQDINDEEVIKLKRKINESIVWCCHIACYPVIYYVDHSEQQVRFFGLSKENKQKYINLHDELIVEIRRYNPNFKRDPSSNIDRLDPPKNIAESDSRDDILNKLQEEVDRKYKIREVEYKQKLYWEEHPDEYQAHLADEKRRKEEIEKRKYNLKTQIVDKTNQLEEMYKDIIRLKSGRGSLGLFAGKEKKAYDINISAIIRNLTELENEVDRLKRQLHEL